MAADVIIHEQPFVLVASLIKNTKYQTLEIRKRQVSSCCMLDDYLPCDEPHEIRTDYGGSFMATNPLGTESIPKLILRFSIPAIISMVVNAIYNMVDQIFIGWGIGMLGIAATNVAFPLNTISTSIALLVGIGGASNFSLNLGRGDEEKARYCAGNAISLLVIFGVSLGLISLIFLRPILTLCGATEQVMPYAVPYTMIICIGIPFMVFTIGACHLIRADGAPTYAMWCMLSGAIFNLIFDPVFLFVFDMGIEGIALATTLGQVLSGGIGAFYLLRRFRTTKITKPYLIPRFNITTIIFSLGVSAFVNQIAMTIVQIMLNNAFKNYGAMSPYGSEIPLAAVGALSKVAILFFGICIGIAQGCQPIHGFNYGAKYYDRVQQTLRIGVIAATCISILSFLVIQIFPKQIIAIFGENDPLYIEFGMRVFRIQFFMMAINGIQPVASNFFASIGKPKIGMFTSLTRQVIFFIPLVLILPMIWGIDGVLFAAPIADGAAAITAILFLLRENRLIEQLKVSHA